MAIPAFNTSKPPVEIIGVRLRLPGSKPVLCFYPVNNFVGAEILSVLFFSRIANARLNASERCLASGGLNDSYFTMAVTDRTAAVKIILQVLKEVRLGPPHSRCCYFDWREDTWRWADDQNCLEEDFLKAAIRIDEEQQALIQKNYSQAFPNGTQPK